MVNYIYIYVMVHTDMLPYIISFLTSFLLHLLCHIYLLSSLKASPGGYPVLYIVNDVGKEERNLEKKTPQNFISYSSLPDMVHTRTRG